MDAQSEHYKLVEKYLELKMQKDNIEARLEEIKEELQDVEPFEENGISFRRISTTRQTVNLSALKRDYEKLYTELLARNLVNTKTSLRIDIRPIKEEMR